ncbi:MAG: LysE family transporter, partial [Bacteroidota bacterium]
MSSIKNLKTIRIIGAGLLISWLGALPLGVLNITAFNVSATQGIGPAIFFAFAAISVELLYVRLSLWGNRKWVLDEKWVGPLLLFGCLLLLFLAISSMLSASEIAIVHQKPGWVGLMNSPILLGFLLSMTNPLQFPFWLTWNKVLLE